LSIARVYERDEPQRDQKNPPEKPPQDLRKLIGQIIPVKSRVYRDSSVV